MGSPKLSVIKVTLGFPKGNFMGGAPGFFIWNDVFHVDALAIRSVRSGTGTTLNI